MNRFSILWLRDEDDHPGTQTRMDISSSLLGSLSGPQITIMQSGVNRVERLLRLIHIVDWISYYAALLNNVAKITPLKKFAQFSFVLVANYIFLVKYLLNYI